MAQLPETMDELISLINTPVNQSDEVSNPSKIEAISALGNLIRSGNNPLTQPKGIMCLVEQVQHPDDDKLVIHAIGVLGRVGAVSAVMTLIDGLLADLPLFNAGHLSDEQKTQVRASAARALGRLKDDRAVIPLMSILNNRDENYRLRLAAAEALGKLGDEHALTSLVEIVQDERESSLYLKESAVKALGMLGDIRAIDSLIHILESKRGIRDKFNFLKERAIESLGRLVGHSVDNDRVVESLTGSLMDEAPSIRLSAVEALGEVADFRVLPRLQNMLFDKDQDVAIAAVESIYHVGGDSAIEMMMALDKLPYTIKHELETYLTNDAFEEEWNETNDNPND